MRWSHAFFPTLREIPKDAEAVSHRLMLRAGMIKQLGSGAYSYLPLGMRVLHRVTAIIREEMNRAGAQEVLLPALHPLELWRASGRDETMKDVLIRFKDRQGREMALGPTHEEIITDLVKGFLVSYKQLPVTLYQIQTKFRDEPRPKAGVLRTKEFLMKDAYSFHRTTEDLAQTFERMRTAYEVIFRRCGIRTIQRDADPGAMGGSRSTEFLAPAACGEDAVTADGQEHTAIELGHIFQLGTKYTEAMNVQFQEEVGGAKPIIMGCYGIGVNRIAASAIEQGYDADGIVWPPLISPFRVLLTTLDPADAVAGPLGDRLYAELQAAGVDVLYDDRELAPGAKFKDADLIGIPVRLVVGKRSAAAGQVELSFRKTKQKEVLQISEVVARVKKQLDTEDRI